MRKQVRPPTPEILIAHGLRWATQWAQLRAEIPSARFQWYQAEGRSARDHVLPALREMTQGHCSFCDAFPLADRSREPIEHFKPKSREEFYRDAYAWENLYYCCERCQSYKQEQWDEALLRPDSPEYSFPEYFMFDFTTGDLLPNPRATPEMRARAEVTIQIYGLGDAHRCRQRKLELRKWQRTAERQLDEWGYRDFLELSPGKHL